VADRPLRPATDRRLGEPLPHQQANPPRARPWSEAEATFSNRPEELLGHPVLIRVSSGYPGTKGGLPTCYSPVRRFPQAEAWFSLDLHVLSAPPAFVLSQDQTLREVGVPASAVERSAGDPFTSSLRSKVRPMKGRRGSFPAPAGAGPGLDVRRTFAVEFSKTSAVSTRRRKKASDSRQRPPRKRIVAYTSRAWRLL
jgi:hypothetical protein